MRLPAALSAALPVVFCASLAQAQVENKEWDGAYDAKAERRSDFTVGASGGVAFGRAIGYPNEIAKIGDPSYRSNTELAMGSGGFVWLGVAFNDYLSFGLGMGGFGLSGNGREASAGLFGFHVDAYPLFSVHPALSDLAVFSNIGTGPLQIKGGADEADGGLMAYVEGGVSYEPLRLWRFAFGPSVSVLHMWSESTRATSALVGGRVVLYAGP